MAKGKIKKTPSRVKYEQKRPTVSFRISKELYDRLQAVKETEGKSTTEVLKVGVGLLEVKVAKEKEARRQGYEEGFEKGYEEAESAAIAKRLEKLYLEIHPSDNLRTIPGVGDHTAPIFLATIGDPARFRSQSSFAKYCGIVPGANQSSGSEAKGLRMTKAGPAIMR